MSLNDQFVGTVLNRYDICRISPSVDTDMFLQITPFRELLTTGMTFVGFLPSVDMDMVRQTATC